MTGTEFCFEFDDPVELLRREIAAESLDRFLQIFPALAAGDGTVGEMLRELERLLLLGG